MAIARKRGVKWAFSKTELNRQHAAVSGSDSISASTESFTRRTGFDAVGRFGKVQPWGGGEFLDIIRLEDSIACMFTSIDKNRSLRELKFQAL